jgi:hypothetical protein
MEYTAVIKCENQIQILTSHLSSLSIPMK